MTLLSIGVPLESMLTPTLLITVFLAAAAPAPKAVADPSIPAVCKSAPVTVDISIECAREFGRQGRYANAELRLRNAKGGNDIQKARIDAELTALVTARDQLAQLDTLERLAKGGHATAAAAQLTALAPNLKNPRVVARFNAVSDEVEWRQNNPIPVLWSWLVTALPVLLLIGALFALRRLLRRFPKRDKETWRLEEVGGSTDRDMKSLIAHHFSNWAKAPPAPAMSGLLVMEPTAIPAYPRLDLDADRFNISPDLTDTDFTIGSVSIKGWIGILPKLRQWLFPQPTAIKGFTYAEDGQLCARLTTRWSDQKENIAIITVSAVGDGSSEAVAEKVAEEVSFKMLYALSSGDVQPATTADELRRGLGLLRDYLTGLSEEGKPTPWDRLEEAQAVFERVRATRPDLLEAHLYEGIALDLLERHEDAAAHFDHVREKAELGSDPKSQVWKEQATYNGAVAHLRNLYDLDSINEAIRRLEGFIGADPDATRLAESPIRALSAATLADAWANRTIEWGAIPNAEVNVSPNATKEEKLRAVIAHHKAQVDTLLGLVGEALTKVREAADSVTQGTTPAQQGATGAQGGGAGGTPAAPGGQAKSPWDPRFTRQVEWAVSNANADFNLYAATSLDRLGLEHQDHLAKALTALRTCEMLLPAGVETLSNLGTLYITRGEEGDLALARRYFQRAIALNPHYEYAYYRLARSWEKESWREKVVETLKSCPVPPGIKSFREMFARYYVEPKLEYSPPQATPAPPPPAPPPPGPPPSGPPPGPAPAEPRPDPQADATAD